MRNSTDIQAHSISLIKDNRVVSIEDYITEIAGDGGSSNVDLSNYSTQTQTDNLLNNKLNVNNPQDILGNLRLDPTNGNSKIIINAVAPATASDDFYCNGNGQFNGSLKVSLLTSEGDLNADGCNADTFNSHITTNDIVFNHNDNEYMRFNATDDELQLSKNIDVGSSTLICNNFDSGLSDVVFNLNSSEYFRFQLSDGTIRVPNTKSFLSQNIFTDIVKPLAFNNDIVFNGGNSTNDAYEEYLRLDASTEKVSVSKNIDTSEHIYMNLNKRLYLNDTVGSERYIVSTFRSGTPSFNQLDIVNENSSNGRIRLMIDTEENVIIENSQLYSKRVITAVAGVNSNTYNSNGNNVVNLQQNGNTFISLQGGNNRVQINRFLRVIDSGAGTQCHFVQNSTGNYMSFTLGNHINAYASGGVNGNTFHINYYSHGNVMLGTNQDTTPDPKPTISINKFSSDTGNSFEVQGDSQFSGDIVIDTGKSVKTNTINSNGNNNLSFQRNGTEFFKLTSIANTIEVADTARILTPRIYTDLIACNNLDADTVFYGSNTAENQAVEYFRFNHINERVDFVKQLRANGNILVKNLQINQFPVGVEYTDFRLENADSIMRFYVGNSTSVNLQITNTELILGRVANCTAGLKSNIIDTYTDTDLIFRRNGVEYFRLDDLTGTDILNVANDKGISASYVFGNRFWNRSFSSDTTFFGSNVAGDDRVEYMRWNYLSQSVDYNAPIDNTNIAIIGNIVDTTVSDERLKTNIKDVESNFTECVKHVKVKTFEYTDEKYKDNDKYGFIAQELLENLPKEFKNIVKETKRKKDEEEGYLSINYMKLSVVLWGCCREQQSKIEHLEASMYEMMEDIKELKGKGSGEKPKPKAKSKSKPKNVD